MASLFRHLTQDEAEEDPRKIQTFTLCQWVKTSRDLKVLV